MKPLVHSLMFVTIGISLFAALFVFGDRVDPVFPEQRERLKILRERAEEIEAITLGHSYAMMVDFDALEMDGFHLWTASEDIFETHFRATSLVPELPNLKTVFVGVATWQFRRDNIAGAAKLPAHFPGKRRELYAVTPGFRYIPGDFGSFIKGKLAPVIRPDHWTSVVRTLLNKNEAMLPVARDGTIGYPAPDSVGREALLRDAEARVAHDRRLEHAMLADRPSVPEDARAAMEDLARFLTQQGMRVVFFTPPFYTPYTEMSDPSAIAEVREFMGPLADSHPDIWYFDHSTDPHFADDPSLFFDSTHLNRRGSKLFSRVLRERLQGDERESAHRAVSGL
jgi:hypothetical protein